MMARLNHGDPRVAHTQYFTRVKSNYTKRDADASWASFGTHAYNLRWMFSTYLACVRVDGGNGCVLSVTLDQFFSIRPVSVHGRASTRCSDA